jgi:hypothetical protein
MCKDFGKILKLKLGDIKARVRGHLANTMKSHVKCYCCPVCIVLQHKVDEHGRALKAGTLQDNRYVRYVDKGVRPHYVAFSISRWMWK